MENMGTNPEKSIIDEDGGKTADTLPRVTNFRLNR